LVGFWRVSAASSARSEHARGWSDGICHIVESLERRVCSSVLTIDWDHFLGPLEWGRAETGIDDRWVLGGGDSQGLSG